MTEDSIVKKVLEEMFNLLKGSDKDELRYFEPDIRLALEKTISLAKQEARKEYEAELKANEKKDIDAIEKAVKERDEKIRKEAVEKMFGNLGSKNVGCVGMSEEFIKGSNWCNNLWKNYIEELRKEMMG